MPEAFKRLTDEERPLAVELWNVVFGPHDSSAGEPGSHRDPWRDRDRLFGCLVDGRVVSAVHLMHRPVHVPGGKWTFGAIAGVATYEEFRGRGYSSRLMRMAMDQMTEDGVDIGLLLTGINPFYEKMGWATIPRTTFRATVQRPFDVRSQAELSADIPSTELAPIHDAFNADRPFAVDRSPEYWKGWADVWMRGATRIVVRDGSKPIAYAVARKWKDGVGVPEIGWLPDCPGAAGKIADELLALTVDWDCEWFGTSAPMEPALIAALDRPEVSIATRTDTALMALPVARSAEELAHACKPFATGAGVFWPLDDF